jgi:hypothetical protein
VAIDGPIDPTQRRLAERRLLDALRRFHRREPLRRDVRVDRMIADLRAADPSRPSTHRGRQPVTLSDAELRAVVDAMVVSGTLLREGHRVSLADRAPTLDPVMRGRVARLVALLSDAGTTPPPAERVANRLGIPAALLDQLRAAGELVSLDSRIDYPRATWAEIEWQIDLLTAGGPLSVRRVRDKLRTTRRHAEAIVRRRAADRDRRGVG